MCGIAGYLSTTGSRPDRLVVERMCRQLVHRGPDGWGAFCDEHVALGHRRLSIIDLNGGAQPLNNEDGSVQVSFNGEIYNYAELRRDLIARGHRLRTASDTEVLVHLYEEVGERLPEYLDGMFAFAIWDARRKQLLIARDRLGKKPLYYLEQRCGVRFAFASELKGLLALPKFSASVNVSALTDFLALSYVPDPDTIYEGVYKLPAGHALLVNTSGVRKWQYWQLDYSEQDCRSPRECISQLRSMAEEAVAKRLISDVPIGAFLSGGVDSSAAVGMMARQMSAPVKTFSIGFTDRRFDELAYARQAAERNRTDHHEEVVTPQIEEVLESLPDIFDEPFADPSAVPMTYLAHMTRRHVTVALSGDGADELFGGYRRYRWGVIEQQWRDRLPSSFRRVVVGAGAYCYPKLDFAPRVFRAKTLLTNISQEIGNAYFTSITALRDGMLDQVLAPNIRVRHKWDSPRQRFCKRFEKVSHLNPLQQMQAVDLETYLPGYILVKTDRVTMAASLEARSPWLDYRMAEFASRLPLNLLIRGRSGKYLFKRAVEPYVPSRLLERTKMGFSVPLASWLRTSLRPVFEMILFQPDLEPFLSATGVRQLWEEHQSAVHNHERRLWNLLMFGLWYARYVRVRAPLAGMIQDRVDQCVGAVV